MSAPATLTPRLQAVTFSQEESEGIKFCASLVSWANAKEVTFSMTAQAVLRAGALMDKLAALGNNRRLSFEEEMVLKFCTRVHTWRTATAVTFDLAIKAVEEAHSLLGDLSTKQLAAMRWGFLVGREAVAIGQDSAGHWRILDSGRFGFDVPVTDTLHGCPEDALVEVTAMGLKCAGMAPTMQEQEEAAAAGAPAPAVSPIPAQD